MVTPLTRGQIKRYNPIISEILHISSGDRSCHKAAGISITQEPSESHLETPCPCCHSAYNTPIERDGGSGCQKDYLNGGRTDGWTVEGAIK